ncbi:hypothetical protein ACFOY2_05070 [Nonomuraea purpurea]|uniref:Uncharacterized protein n=1 Tax=Nonomuraea purpurea TaxID=1849276 RepID=A0ABV8G1Y3_9ACTN
MLMTAKKRLRPEQSKTARTWQARAVHLLNQAITQIRDGEDAIPTVGAAMAVLRIEIGELPADELDFLFSDSRLNLCICPPDLLARGGFRGDCPVRASH